MAYTGGGPKRAAKRSQVRQEADRLMEVVLAFMDFTNEKDEAKRKMAHKHFRDTVCILHEFVTAEELPGESSRS